MSEHLGPAASRLLREATEDLPDDGSTIGSTISRGIARGRSRRRRRRITSVLAAVVVVGGVGLAAGVVPGLLAGTGALGEPAGVAADPTRSPAPGPTEGPTAGSTSTPDPRTPLVPLDQRDLPDAFAGIFPGEVSAPEQEEYLPEAPNADFTWNGFGVRVALTPADFVTGEVIADPLERCREYGGGPAPCRTREDGSVLQSLESTAPAADGGIVSRFVTLYRTDGWDVTLVSHNAPDSSSTPIADEPPFTLRRLLEAADSDVFFDSAR